MGGEMMGNEGECEEVGEGERKPEDPFENPQFLEALLSSAMFFSLNNVVVKMGLSVLLREMKWRSKNRDWRARLFLNSALIFSGWNEFEESSMRALAAMGVDGAICFVGADDGTVGEREAATVAERLQLGLMSLVNRGEVVVLLIDIISNAAIVAATEI
ncbi:hypothetical protein LOK49_LG07G02223 [Camellia lanceoleosa]|uniref:Uncharacterized protein n=1 Tax=Camellia lanceoleosa TaxID=1840588 RepID=A0ACC0H1T5_9ERIC|nr:hypothetical protein LOK49_LG07G02223 [Camellia lanceoleosa]